MIGNTQKWKEQKYAQKKTYVENAVSGDAVLLSPACASWGMFDNYEQRGRIFKDLVNNL